MSICTVHPDGSVKYGAEADLLSRYRPASPETVPSILLPNRLHAIAMADTASFRNRLRAELSSNLPVTLTAIGLALTAFVLLSLDTAPFVSTDFGGRFLLAMSLMDIAFIYDAYWPAAYRPPYAVTWTLLIGVLSADVFVGGYEGVRPYVGPTAAGVVAFSPAIGIQLCSSVLHSSLR